MTAPSLSAPRRGGISNRLRRGSRTSVPSTPSDSGFSIGAAIRELLTGVEWTPALIAFMYYYFVVITYYLPGADIAIVASVLLLGLQISTLRVGRALGFFGAFVVWAWVAYLTSPNRDQAFDETWILTKLWVVVFVAFNVLRTRAQVRMFMAFAALCWVFFPLRGATVNYFIGNTVFGRAVWNKTYNNPNDLAAFALMFLSVIVALAFASRSRLVRWASSLASLLTVGLVFFTQSRGALLALGVVTVIVVATTVRNPKTLLRVAVLLGLSAFFAPKQVWTRLSGLSNVSVEGGMKGVDREGSAEQRYQILGIALRIAQDHPISGVGAGTYQITHEQYARDLHGEFPTAGGKKDAHNTYAHAAAELGIVGLAIFLSNCFVNMLVAFKRSRRYQTNDRQVIRALAIGLLAYMLAGIFASLEYINALYLHLALLECTLLAYAGAAPMLADRRASTGPRRAPKPMAAPAT